MPSEYESTREPLEKKMFIEGHRHSRGGNACGEAAPVEEHARQREQGQEEARWPIRAGVLKKVRIPWHRTVLDEVKDT